MLTSSPVEPGVAFGTRRSAGQPHGQDLLHPPLRAAEALGDDKCATTDRIRSGDELLIDSHTIDRAGNEPRRCVANVAPAYSRPRSDRQSKPAKQVQRR